jgi:hypothetical protein
VVQWSVQVCTVSPPTGSDACQANDDAVLDRSLTLAIARLFARLGVHRAWMESAAKTGSVSPISSSGATWRLPAS